MLARVRAALVMPFQHHVLAFIFGQLLHLSVIVNRAEAGSGIAHLHSQCADCKRQNGGRNNSEPTEPAHSCLPEKALFYRARRDDRYAKLIRVRPYHKHATEFLYRLNQKVRLFENKFCSGSCLRDSLLGGVLALAGVKRKELNVRERPPSDERQGKLVFA